MKKALISICFLIVSAGFFSFLFINTPSVRAATSWAQSNWFGGPGQTNWSDVTKYNTEDGVNTYVANQATLNPGTFATAYGGSGDETVWSIRKTPDGGMIVGGSTNSSGAGGFDGMLIKLDSVGNILWQKTYGGSGHDFFNSVQQTGDGGYIAVGYTLSFGAGDGTNGDFWVVKTDSLGNVLWQNAYGGANFEYATAVMQNAAGNYMVMGSTMSFGSGSYDVWILELNPVDGSVLWQNVYGGANYDIPNTPDLIKQTLDGGYIIAADSRSFSVGSDLLVFKINSTGTVLWQNVYDGIGGGASATVVLADGSYLVAGDVNSFGAGNFDYWVLHLDASGNILWQKTYGGAGEDSNVNVIQTSDGNFLLSGNSKSVGFGGYDIWTLKIDLNGNIIWQKAYGGLSDENTYSMPQEMSDGGYVIGGHTGSFGVGGKDAWVLKIAPDGSIYNSSLFSEDTNIVPADGLGTASATALVVSSPAITITPPPGTIVSSNSSFTTTPTSSSGGDNYARSGALTSSIFDGGTIMSWGPLNYNAITPNNTAISFETSTDGGLTWEPVTDITTQTFGPSQTIAYRVSLSNTDGVATPVLQNVSINGSETPIVLTSPASSIVKTKVTLNGNLIGVGAAAVTSRGFEYGLTNSYGSTVSESSGPYTNGVFSIDVLNLTCEKIYNYRAYATNSFGTSYGDNVTFTTGGCDSSGGGGTSSPPTLCRDATALNYGDSLPCTYPKPNPTVFLVANPTTITEGEASTLRWTATNSVSCNATWTTSTDTSGSVVVQPGQTTKYKIVCSGITGTIPASSAVVVTIKNAPILCQDTAATNLGGPIPCVYPIIPPDQTTCLDEKAINHGGQLPCVYPKPVTFCEDERAINKGETLPCVYKTTSDSSQADINKITQTALSTTRTVLNDPKTKIIKNVAIAIPVSISLVALFASLLSGVPLLNYLAYLFIVISQFLGFRRTPKPWGVVYDSYTKRPIPFARVEVLNEQARKLQSTITDINGRYGFLISAQVPNITLQAFRTKYDFPSKSEPGIIEQKLYPSIYKGGTINVPGGFTNYDLPMDPREKTASRNFYFGISSIKLNNVLTYITNILFVLGVILSLVNVAVNPSATSAGVVAIILLTIIVRSSGLKLKPFGLTKDAETSKTLPFSFVALHNREGERVNFTVSDDIGRYFLLTPKGNYLLKAYTPSYVSAARTREIMVSARRGWVSKEIII